MTSIAPIRKKRPENVAFHRAELSQILNVYGRLVQSGTARDYAIGMFGDRAVFAIHRRHSERASWRIEKVPALALQQGAYVVYGTAGQVLRRGRELAQVLRVFDSRRFEVIRG